MMPLNNDLKPGTKWSNISSILLQKYASILIRYPFWVLIGTGSISVLFSTLGIIYGNPPELHDPKLGFETRNTDLSRRILTWRILDDYQLSPYPNNTFNYFRRLDQFRNGPFSRRKRSHHADLFTELISSLNIGPCLQIGHPFKEAKWFSHVILESTSTNHLFSLDSIKEMCKLQDYLNATFDSIRKAIKYPNFWALPNYLSCMSGNSNCTFLTQSDIDDRLADIRICYPFKSLINQCYNPEIETDDLRFHILAESKDCSETLPEVCRSKYFYDLYNFVLSNNMFTTEILDSGGPVYTNLVLPIMQLTTYEYEKTPGVNLEKFKEIYDQMLSLKSSVKEFKLVGLNLGIKMQIYGYFVNQDSSYGIYCAIVAAILCLLYSGSIFYSTCVLLSLGFSLGISYFIYCIIFAIDFFPFINLLVVVLLVGIGADNTFVLKHIFDHGQDHRVDPATDEDQSDQSEADQEISADAKLRKSIILAAKSMFITNATTAAAFYANFVSDIIVMKCFGLFAGTTMVINYLLIISFLPASLIIHERYIKPKFSKMCKFGKFDRTATISKISAFVGKVLYKLAYSLKFLWIILFTVIFAGSLVVIFYKPGLRLPSRNPLLLFRKDNPLEWYDDNMEQLFDFSNDYTNQAIDVEILWGFKLQNLGKTLNPEIDDPKNIDLKIDKSFELGMKELHFLGEIYQNLYSGNISFEKHNSSSFYAQFLQWSLSQECNGRLLCCNSESPKYSPKNFDACLVESTKTLDTYPDGPIFDAHHIGGPAPAYIMSLRTTFKNSLLYNNLKTFYDSVDSEIEKVTQKIADSQNHSESQWWWVTNDQVLMTWYDLQRSLLHGTPISIAASVFIALLVVILSTRTFLLSFVCVFAICGVISTTIACLVLFGWNLNIVESTVIILTAGLSFDFTLLYAAAYKIFAVAENGAVRKEEKVEKTLNFMALPVLLSALTTCGAGLCMLPAYTMAYFQIGLFMILVTVVSWLVGSLFFPSILLVLDPIGTRMCSKRHHEET